MKGEKFQCANCGEIREGEAIIEDLAMLTKHGIVEPLLTFQQEDHLKLRCVLRPLSDVEIGMRLIQNTCEFKKCQ